MHSCPCVRMWESFFLGDLFRNATRGWGRGRRASVLFSFSTTRRTVLSSHSCLIWRLSLMSSHFTAGFPSHLGLRNARHVSGYAWFLVCKLPVCLLGSAFYLIDLLTFHSFILDIDYMHHNAFSVCISGFHVYSIRFCWNYKTLMLPYLSVFSSVVFVLCISFKKFLPTPESKRRS